MVSRWLIIYGLPDVNFRLGKWMHMWVLDAYPQQPVAIAVNVTSGTYGGSLAVYISPLLRFLSSLPLFYPVGNPVAQLNNRYSQHHRRILKQASETNLKSKTRLKETIRSLRDRELGLPLTVATFPFFFWPHPRFLVRISATRKDRCHCYRDCHCTVI